MMKRIKRFLWWQFKFTFSVSGPILLVFIFAMLQEYLFPDSPVWPIGVFALFIIFIVARYVKW